MQEHDNLCCKPDHTTQSKHNTHRRRLTPAFCFIGLDANDAIDAIDAIAVMDRCAPCYGTARLYCRTDSDQACGQRRIDDAMGCFCLMLMIACGDGFPASFRRDGLVSPSAGLVPPELAVLELELELELGSELAGCALRFGAVRSGRVDDVRKEGKPPTVPTRTAKPASRRAFETGDGPDRIRVKMRCGDEEEVAMMPIELSS
ncbi:hypothetical protein EG329_001885 [Mollisiaceae sp. DMI_Dod_QoI]|nr:hypothetical protein EG329_001885 [Helotiales sp. DMI_Dod_QoI]